MTRKQFLYYELTVPVIWFLSLLAVKGIRSGDFPSALQDSANLTLLFYVLFNSILYFKFDKLKENKKSH